MVSRSAVIVACLGIVALSFSQRTYHQFSYELKATNQSLWAPGTGRIDYTKFLGTSFSSSDTYNGYFNFFGETGVAGNASITGQTGLRFSAFADGGSVDIAYPVKIEIGIPERDFLVPGGPVVVTTSYVRSGTASMVTRSPDANVIAEGFFKAQPSVTMTGKLSGETLFSGQALSNSVRNIDLNVQLFNLRNYVLPGSSDVSIDIFPTYPNLLRADLHWPVINITQSLTDSNGLIRDLRGKARDRIFTLTGNITAAVIYLLQTAVGSPPFNFLDQSVSFPPKSPAYTFAAGYSLLRAEARGVVGFQKDVEFLPRPRIRLELASGTFLAEGPIGQNLTFTMPTSGAADIRAIIYFDNDFKTTLSLTLGGGLYFIPMEFYAGGSIGPFSLGGFNLQPLDPYALESSIPFKLFDRQFMLAGFNTPQTTAMPVRANTSPDPAVFYSVNFPGDTFARFGDNSATLRLEGRPLGYLASNSVIYVNNTAIATTFDSTNNYVQCTLTRPTHNAILNTLNLSGFDVQVKRPGFPDSNILKFEVGYKLPIIDQLKNGGIEFTTYDIGSTNVDLQLEVSGPGNTYSDGLSVVYWNEQPVPTTYPQPFTGSVLHATVPKEILNIGGQIWVTVRTPLPGGGVSNPKQVFVRYPSPQWHESASNRLNPTSGRSVGDDGLTITVQGNGFVNGHTPETRTTVMFKKPGAGSFVALETVFEHAGKLHAVIPASQLDVIGDAEVVIRGPNLLGDGFIFTSGQTFRVLKGIPFLNRCDPSIVPRGTSGPLTVRVYGKGFRNDTTLFFNNFSHAYQFISPNEIRFTANTSHMANGAVLPVEIQILQPTGAVEWSNEEWFTVRNPKPTISTLTPNTRQAYSSAFTLIVTGSGFESSAQVYWNGQPRNTTFVNSTRVDASIPAADLNYPGMANVQVQNYPSEYSNGLPFTISEATTIYVSPTGNDAFSGNTWQNAKRTVQAGINTAVAGQQVWVRHGTYNERITLKSGVRVFGGFAGNETSLWQRNLVSNVSILDGQAGGSVVTSPSGATPETMIDGFTIRNGLAANGSGINITIGSPVISNNVIRNNGTTGATIGAAIYVNTGNPKVLNNIIHANTSTHSVIYNVSSGAQYINNTIHGNTSTNAPTGAAIFASDNTNILLANNIFTNHSGGPNIDRKNVGTAAFVLRNNLVRGASPNYRNQAAGASDFADDPLYVNVSLGDFRIQPGSPCFDRGFSPDALIIPVDAEGNDRFFGLAVDVGADEINAFAATQLSAGNNSVYIGGTVALSAFLYGPLQTPIANQPVHFFVNGQSIDSGTTNVIGQATVQYTAPMNMNVGNYPLDMEFPGFRGYAGTTLARTLTVLRTQPTVTPQSVATESGLPVQLRARLTLNTNNAPMPGHSISFKIADTIVGSGVTDADGWATLNYTVPPGVAAATYSLKAEFGGTANFHAATSQTTFIVNNTPPIARLAGKSFRSPGINDRAEVAGFGTVVPTTEMTIEFWQLADSVRQQAPITLNGGSNTNRIVIHSPWSDGVVYWDFGNIFTGGRLAYTPPQSVVGTWQHFAMVVSQNGNFMRIYRNGVLEAQKVGMTPFANLNMPLLIGGSGFLGELDDVRVWNYAREQFEIQRGYRQPLKGTEPGLIGYWRMDDSLNGNTLTDSSGNGRTAMFVGSPRFQLSGATINRAVAHANAPRSVKFAGFDVNDDPLSFGIASPPGLGSVYGGPTSFTFVPPGGISGTSPFQFKANDGMNESPAAGAIFDFDGGVPSATLAGLSIDLAAGAYANVGSSNALKMTNALTIEAWINPQPLLNINEYGIIVNREGEYEIARFWDGSIRYALANSNPGWAWISTGYFVPAGEWTHIALTYDVAAGQIRFYANGQLVHTRLGVGNIGDIAPAQNDFRIGWRQTLDALGRYRGQIDEVRIWNRARTAQEIARDWRAVLRGNEPGLKGLWRMEDRGDGTLIDGSGHNPEALLFGTFVWRVSGANIDTVNCWVGQSANVLLKGFTAISPPLTFDIMRLPSGGALGGTPPNLTFTPSVRGATELWYRTRNALNFISDMAKVRLVSRFQGDANGDGCVDDIDLAIVLGEFGGTTPGGDLNQDGIVDDVDLAIVLSQFGLGC